MKMENLGTLLQETMKLKVLYVEDDEETRKHTLKMLHNFFSDIAVETNGSEGFKTFSNGNYDVIFTDINMPTMDGIEMLQNIRDANTQIPIIIFSAYDDTEYFLKSIRHGVDGYLLKPFQYEDIEEVMLKILEKTAHSREKHRIMHLLAPFYWDITNEALYKGASQIKLTKSELALFRLLTSKSHTVYAPVDIELYVFDDDTSDVRRVRNLLSRLKNKLQCELIESIYAEGYRLKQ